MFYLFNRGLYKSSLFLVGRHCRGLRDYPRGVFVRAISKFCILEILLEYALPVLRGKVLYEVNATHGTFSF